MEIKKDKDLRWYDVKFVPDKYIFAKENRPQKLDGPVCDSFPVIDLAKRSQAVDAILMASQNFGVFQVINHGAAEKTLIDALNVLKEFYDMPSKEAAGPKKGWFHTDSTWTKDGAYLWRESLKHPCHPLEECSQLWPEKPTRYREVMQAYLLEIQKLSASILEMISEGLGLEPGYFKGMSEVQVFSSNFYPPCPDPSLTIGLTPHKDPSLITLVYQGDSTGLQILKDGQWVNVAAIQNSFVVNIGNQLEIKKDKDLRWYDVKFVPDKYIFAKENRPQNLDGPLCDSFPVIDLAKRTQAIDEILMASQNFGVFQVINHGAAEKTMIDALNVLKEFYDMPSKEAAGHKKGWFHTDSTWTNDGAYLWRESLKHPCHPLEECSQLWPGKPTRYREVMQAYLLEIQKLSASILEMISEGLGLEPGYFKGMSEVQVFSSNFYPPCPDPSLTIGLTPHKDPSLITLVYQGDSTGLQILKDGQWVNVAAIQNSFVVNIGNQLEIISNGKLKSIYHRVLNSTEARISIAVHVNPSTNCVIEPAKVLVHEREPSHYKASLYDEYIHSNNAFGDLTASLYNSET